MKKDIIEINESTIKKFVESLRPEDPEIREKLDFGYSYDGKIIEIFEIRLKFDIINLKIFRNYIGCVGI